MDVKTLKKGNELLAKIQHLQWVAEDIRGKQIKKSDFPFTLMVGSDNETFASLPDDLPKKLADAICETIGEHIDILNKEFKNL